MQTFTKIKSKQIKYNLNIQQFFDKSKPIYAPILTPIPKTYSMIKQVYDMTKVQELQNLVRLT